MAFKIKDNLDLYGNQLLNFALQADSGFYSSPQIGHMFYYTGAGALANHPVVCVNPNDTSGNKFKALAFVDEIATNAEFVELKEKVDLLIGDDVDTDTIIDSWKEVQAFLADIEDTKTLQGMLSSYLPKSGGTIESSGWGSQLTLKRSVTAGDVVLGFANSSKMLGYLGFNQQDIPFYMSVAGATYPLLHSGNIEEYALKTDGSNVMKGHLTLQDHYVKFADASGNTLGIYNVSSVTKLPIYNVNGTWKTIAFTDSDITGNAATATLASKANQLCTKPNGLAFAYADEESAYMTLGRNNYAAYLDGSSVTLRYGSSLKQGFILNSSGNVTIGGSDLYGIVNAKLHVDGRVGLKNMMLVHNSDTIADSGAFLLQYYTGGSDKLLALTARNTSLGLKYNILAANWESGNVLIGTTEDKGQKLYVVSDKYAVMRIHRNLNSETVGAAIACSSDYAELGTMGWNRFNEFKLQDGENNKFFYGGKDELCLNTKKTTITGDLVVEGNIIGKKEVSAGGAGQEGESGDGGAEVLAQQLAKGQSTYSITNTIGRPDIAVSLYEWNANNESWDMCLADISVKDATITITFGSATSVNHKIVAVG